jgi:predicted AlkP superfamily pyrophosphatase or phosphodiesterase
MREIKRSESLSFVMFKTVIMRLILTLFLAAISVFIYGQKQDEKPKLVVAIVVDQMRYEYLERFQDKYGDDGFKRLMTEGFNFRNHHYNYVPTTTGPGHTAIFTGAVPSVSGIINNSWYDKVEDKVINVVGGNDKYLSIGIDPESSRGHAGPDNLLCTTIGDELKKASQMKSKVFTISIKDRSAILAAGHTGDGAFWFDSPSGNFISSSYYMDELPAWVVDFNNSGYVDSLNHEVWDLSYPEEKYTTSRPANNESKIASQERPTFPYDLKEITGSKGGYYFLPYTPFGNEMVAELGKQALISEKIGKSDFIDFLSVCFSSTDYVGHRNGPYSLEIEDMYVKLDRTIADFLQFLDGYVGKENYTLFLTADHGVLASPLWLADKKFPGGVYKPYGVKSRLNEAIKEEFDVDTAILYGDNYQFYLNDDHIEDQDQKEKIAKAIRILLEEEEFIQQAFTREELLSYSNPTPSSVDLLKNSFHHQRSGDVFFITRPGWLNINTARTATTHGSAFSYDTHVPLLWYGKNIPKGHSVRRVNITDIAPTITAFCRVMLPSGTYGNPLIELFD